jgi:hypothetical protein
MSQISNLKTQLNKTSNIMMTIITYFTLIVRNRSVFSLKNLFKNYYNLWKSRDLIFKLISGFMRKNIQTWT